MTSTEPGSGTLQYQRQREIYSLALTTGSVDVAALARLFNVTTETIRRDLSDLQDRQLLRRVHGGAVPFERRDHEPMVDARGVLERRGEAADRPGSDPRGAAAGLGHHRLREHRAASRRGVPGRPRRPRDHELADHRGDARPARHQDAHRHRWPGADEHAGDGRRRGRAGRQPAQRRRRVHELRRVVVHRGLTTPYSAEATLKHAMIEASRRVVAIVDQSKFGNDQLFNFVALDDLDVLVTDTRADDAAVRAIAAHGVEVRRA